MTYRKVQILEGARELFAAGFSGSTIQAILHNDLVDRQKDIERRLVNTTFRTVDEIVILQREHSMLNAMLQTIHMHDTEQQRRVFTAPEEKP